jgi:hypothetical protein
MKKKIALMLTVLGVAATLVPMAEAKPSRTVPPGGVVCICPPPASFV